MSRESDDRIVRAEAIFIAGDVATALRLLEEVLREDPLNDRARALYGQCLRGELPSTDPAGPPPLPPDAPLDHEQLVVPSVHWHDARLVVRFDWPPGARSVTIGMAPDDGSSDENAIVDAGTPLTLKGYDDAGGLYVAARPPPCDVFWVFVFEERRAIGWVRVERPREPIVWHIRTERSVFRKVLRRSLHLRASDTRDLTGLRLVQSPDRAPLHPADGRTILLLDRVTFEGGAAMVELPPGSPAGVLRLFPADVDRARGVWCLAEEGLDEISP